MFRPNTPLSSINWNRCLNISGEIIPSFACVKMTDADPDDGIVEVDKHDENGSALWAINSATPILIGEEGECTRTTPAHVRYDSSSGSPVNGETWGPQAGEWSIFKDFPGFTIVGGAIEAIDGIADLSRVIVIAEGGGSASNPAFLAKLTDKTYTPGEFTAYTWEPVTDSDTPPIGYTPGDESEMPAYHEQNVDIPVPAVVRLRRGNGDYYLIDQMPRVEFVRKAGAPVSIGGVTYIPGELMRYDQTTKTLIVVTDVLIRDLNTA